MQRQGQCQRIMNGDIVRCHPYRSRSDQRS
jgi:hypothetical protein